MSAHELETIIGAALVVLGALSLIGGTLVAAYAGGAR